MPKINRGETTQIEVQLSLEALTRLNHIMENLNVSRSAAIVFLLPFAFKTEKTKVDLINLENKYILEKKDIGVRILEKEFSKLTYLAEQLEMKRNQVVGLILSDFIMGLPEDHCFLTDNKNTSNEKVLININSQLHEKMETYSKTHFTPSNALIAYAVLKGMNYKFPKYETNEQKSIFTSLPQYLVEIVKQKSNWHNISESLFIELCLFELMFHNENFLNHNSLS